MIVELTAIYLWNVNVNVDVGNSGTVSVLMFFFFDLDVGCFASGCSSNASVVKLLHAQCE